MPISTDLDKVRLLISDVGGSNGTSFLFNDDEINAFLTLRPNVFLAAALALRTIAANEAQTAKRIKVLDLETDGPAVARELRLQAAQIEALADEDADFEIASMGVDQFSRRELRGL